MIHEKRWPLSSYISHWWAVASGGWSSYFGWAPLVPCDVDWKRRGRRWLLGNCHAAQISNRDTVSFSLSKNHSCLCDANTLSTFVWSTVSQQLLLAEGRFLDSDIKADWSAFGCQRKLTMLFFFFLPENDLGKHSKLFGPRWLNINLSETKKRRRKTKDVPVWWWMGHLSTWMWLRGRVWALFLMFSHHELRSDSWDKKTCLSSPNC